MSEITTRPLEETTDAAHTPLPPGRYALLLLSATAIIVVFYLYAAIALVVVVLLMLVFVALIVGGMQTGTAAIAAAPAHALLGCAKAILRALNLKRSGGDTKKIVLTQNEAPAFLEMVHRTAAAVGVQPPDEVWLLHGDNAWVSLRGFRRGRGKVRLGIGLELLVILTEAETEAVVAHEMAHAKLIQRGYQAVAFRGVERIHRLVEALENPPPQRDMRTYKSFQRIGRWLAWVPDKLSHTGTRLIAASSRQEEFLADQLAARICGSEIYRQTLIRTHVVGPLTARLSWRDHLLHRGEGYIAWLQGALRPEAMTDAAEAERKALADIRRSDFGTHPVLRDRLAALPQSTPPRPLSAAPALDFFTDPVTVANRLIDEIERVANIEERKDNERLRRWLRKEGRSRQVTPVQAGGALAAGAGAVLLAWLAFNLVALPAWQVALGGVAGAVVLAAGLCVYRRGRDADGLVLPVPPFDLWDAAVDARTELRDAENWREPLSATMRAELPPEVTSKPDRRRWWLARSYEALATCDYQRAHIASRLALEADRKHPDCLAPHCITSAYFGPTGQEREVIDPLYVKRGIGPSMSWAMAWVDLLTGDWESAEVFLLDAVERRPQEATLHSLLALAHWGNGKIREATENSNRAVAMEPEGKTHRLTRARILLSAGSLKAALEDLDWLVARGEPRVEFLIARVEAAVALGDEEMATQRADETFAAFPTVSTRMRLAAEFMDSQDAALRRHAVTQYEAVLEQGFYPEAEMGLARAFCREENFPVAREHLLAALNIERDRPDDADRPLTFLPNIVDGLRAMDGTTVKCTAWNSTLTLIHEGIRVKGVELLVCHTSQALAAELVREIWQATQPSKTWDESFVVWELLAAKEQPTELMTPGIYGHEWIFN